MVRVVEDCIVGGNKGAPESAFFAGIEIAIEAREIAAGNLQAQGVAAEKHVGGGPEIEGNFIDLARIHQGGVFRGTTIAHAQNALGKILGEAVGRNVDELCREVGIDSRGFYEEIGSDRAGDF